MERGDSDKTKTTAGGKKITAAHLAGLRPRPSPEESPLGKWDVSTAFVAGAAFAILTVPEMSAVYRASTAPGVAHSASDLLILLAFIACFGIFPVVIFQHLYMQHLCKRPTAFSRFASAIVALALMFFATDAMKPLVGYDQKVAENTRELIIPRVAREAAPPVRVFGGASRSPASLLLDSDY